MPPLATPLANGYERWRPAGPLAEFEMIVRKKNAAKEDFAMGTLLGFALGFYLGTKAGPNGIDDLTKAWQTISESEEFQALSATARATLESLMEQGAAGVAQFVTGLMGAEEEPGSEHPEKPAARNGNLQGLWAAVSQTFQAESAASTGAALVMQLFEQGMSAARGRI
ncbi:MAG TPA: hypothetical protein VGY99_24460 [Candidatus Binataceae bacterium]|nr:hypothetical protein [Candidatus Binataceae bacterium]